MQLTDNFVFINPIPYAIFNKSDIENSIWLAPFTAKECVEFFWRIDKIVMTITGHLYVYDDINDRLIMDSTLDDTIDSSNCNGAFSKSSLLRVEEDFLIYGDAQSTTLYLMGPYRYDSGGDDIDFIEQLFAYNLQINSSVGGIQIESTFIEENDDTIRTTIKTIPFDFLGKTYYMYMNASNGFLEEYGNGYTVSYDASINFDIQYYEDEDDESV